MSFCNRLFILLLSTTFLASISFATPIQVVAAESFYGKLAQEIGGDEVSVHSIIDNPQADPHLFSTSVETAKKAAHAQIIIYNGANYDPWMKHIWYKPETFPRLAKEMAFDFSILKPDAKKTFAKNLNNFEKSYQTIYPIMDKIRHKYQGTTVAATTPLYNYMAKALGLKVKGHQFEWLTMNGSEPSPRIMANFEKLLQLKKVRLLFNNKQVTNPNVTTLLALAKKHHKPIVSFSETLPAGLSITEWIKGTLEETLSALQGPKIKFNKNKKP